VLDKIENHHQSIEELLWDQRTGQTKEFARTMKENILYQQAFSNEDSCKVDKLGFWF
jgi:hypothetical protein